MSRYRGLHRQPDKIVGGGSWVQKNGTGHEVCNFTPVTDGYVYGHVETFLKEEKDRQICIENWGGNGDSLSGVDLVWTATHPQEKGRRIIGWYRDATIYRERQYFNRPPTKQHKLDGISSYRARTLVKNTRVLDVDARTLIMPHGKGWMGQTPWWSPADDAEAPIQDFLQKVRNLLKETEQAESKSQANGISGGKNSPGTAKSPYTCYIEEHEIRINPRHNQLQSQFEDYLAANEAKNVQANLESVDLRYWDPKKGNILVEVKPCEPPNTRYAIRTAMGQLLDYRQRAKGEHALLIVVEVKPREEDRLLATSNGFGVAYPARGKFKIVWPES